MYVAHFSLTRSPIHCVSIRTAEPSLLDPSSRVACVLGIGTYTHTDLRTRELSRRKGAVLLFLWGEPQQSTVERTVYVSRARRATTMLSSAIRT